VVGGFRRLLELGRVLELALALEAAERYVSGELPEKGRLLGWMLMSEVAPASPRHLLEMDGSVEWSSAD
jgi:hypothetical protein